MNDAEETGAYQPGDAVAPAVVARHIAIVRGGEPGDHIAAVARGVDAVGHIGRGAANAFLPLDGGLGREGGGEGAEGSER